MPFDIARARVPLQDGNLEKLFIEELGWEPSHKRLAVHASDNDFALSAIAEKCSLTVWLCLMPGNALPDHATRLKIDREVAQTSFEHLIIFSSSDKARQLWMWMRREKGKPLCARTHEFIRGQSGDSLLQKLQFLFISLEEEDAGLLITQVAGRVRAAFDLERVTKAFYRDFDIQRKAFLKFIAGIDDVADREWYASVTLNRLMFVYFIQRKGFLDGDPDYLRNRLIRCRQERGKDAFYSFYRFFLLRLFHEGFGQKPRQRAAGLEKLLGRIPYLNGGLFDMHKLEKPNRYGKSIQIPDQAFQHIFDYFDQYQWHLDERPLRDDKEINPDVLGYIFEKYINQKQMGAYYTKEDITEYISKNTVLPFIFETAQQKCRVAFENPTGPTVWNLLRDNPDRYIYEAVRHGMEHDLPPEIAEGVDAGKPNLIERRKGWNKPAPAEFALPTEIWREVVARRTRCGELRRKLSSGEVSDINDLITLNLDIRQFAQDVITNCEGPDLLRAIWHAIEKVTILDPTCGSGAFLFAALNILEPLYEACLDRMELFLNDEAAKIAAASQRLSPAGNPILPHKKFEDFTAILDRVAAHPNRRYFIFKSIILNNLFGVDIMEEAVEICKLRLFLKLAAQVDPDINNENLGIEPLPDIDFNIRAGNTLVGYATVDEVKKAVTSAFDFDNAMEKISIKAADLQQTFDAFRLRQTEGDGSVPPEHKQELQKRFKALEDELNLHLAGEYGVKTGNKAAYAKWLKSHQPFHWFIEFYGIINSGGFDVIIGNPPYVEYSKIRKSYAVQPSYATLSCSNLYALILERCFRNLSREKSWLSLIVPLSLVSTSRTIELQELIKRFPAWISSYDMRPGSLFEGVAQRLCIIISSNRENNKDQCYSGGYRRWRSEERPSLMHKIAYVQMSFRKAEYPFSKFSQQIEKNILPKIQGVPLGNFASETYSGSIYVHRIIRYFVKALNFIPLFIDPDGNQGKSEDYKEFRFDPNEQDQIAAILNSTLFYWQWRSNCDGFHCGYGDVYATPYKIVDSSIYRQMLKMLLEKLMHYLQSTSKQRMITTKTGQIRYQEFYLSEAKSIIDEIDHVLAQHYGFTEEELDFIINYDIKYRMGRDAESEDE